jgi:hypothetical protein
MFNKIPMHRPFKVRRLTTGLIYTFICIHDPNSDKFAFKEIYKPFEKLTSAAEMSESFELV